MKISKDISWKQLQDKVVAVNLTSGVYYTLNPVASTIWRHLADGKEREEMVSLIAEEYDASAEEIAKDTDEIISYWKKENLID